MKIIINNKLDKAIYLQIYEQISAQILCGDLPANFMLPSIRKIAKEIEVSIITVKNAYEMLEENGFIYTRAGIGCFVCELHLSELDTKKLQLAKTQLAKDLPYYKDLGLTEKEFLELLDKEVKELWKK